MYILELTQMYVSQELTKHEKHAEMNGKHCLCTDQQWSRQTNVAPGEPHQKVRPVLRSLNSCFPLAIGTTSRTSSRKESPALWT